MTPPVASCSLSTTGWASTASSYRAAPRGATTAESTGRCNQRRARRRYPKRGWSVLRPQQDSNLRTRLRRAVLYPLSYGGWRYCHGGQLPAEPKTHYQSQVSPDTAPDLSAPVRRSGYPHAGDAGTGPGAGGG